MRAILAVSRAVPPPLWARSLAAPVAARLATRPLRHDATSWGGRTALGDSWGSVRKFAEAAPAAAEGAEGAEGAEAAAGEPTGPRVLWRAGSIAEECTAVEGVLDASSVAIGSGQGFALLGVAPFTPPNPFMFGIFLGLLSVRLAHLWTVRQLMAQSMRHVIEVELLSGCLGNLEEPVRLRIVCDGGLTRTLELVAPKEGEAKPAFSQVMQQGVAFIWLDRELGRAEDESLLEQVLQSERVIASEELQVKSSEGEPQQEAEKIVQRLGALTKEHLKKIGAQEEASPTAQIARLKYSAQLSGVVILTVGVIICFSGRSAADAMLQKGGP